MKSVKTSVRNRMGLGWGGFMLFKKGTSVNGWPHSSGVALMRTCFAKEGGILFNIKTNLVYNGSG